MLVTESSNKTAEREGRQLHQPGQLKHREERNDYTFTGALL
jgi:hypothetical protein